MVVAWVAITDCIISLPSALSTATEMVLWWTSRPIYLMLSIGCSFRQVWFTASHSNHNLLRKGRPFIMRAPPKPVLLGWVFLQQIPPAHTRDFFVPAGFHLCVRPRTLFTKHEAPQLVAQLLHIIGVARLAKALRQIE